MKGSLIGAEKFVTLQVQNLRRNYSCAQLNYEDYSFEN